MSVGVLRIRVLLVAGVHYMGCIARVARQQMFSFTGGSHGVFAGADYRFVSGPKR